ncbi:MAG: hypothetical protein Tsb002_18730 [Wenzhouxiangellaceae bacterium]
MYMQKTASATMTTPSIANLINDGGIERALQQLLHRTQGIEGLADCFAEHGFAHLVNSWRQGQARHVSPHQLFTVLGYDGLRRLAGVADLSLAQTLAGLAAILPRHMVSSYQQSAH